MAQPSIAPPQAAPDFRPTDLAACNEHVRAFFDAYAAEREKWRRRNLGYHLELERQYKFVIPRGSRVLEVGCGTGDLLAALEPAFGMGVDLAPNMIETAQQNHASSNLRFVASSIEEFCAAEALHAQRRSPKECGGTFDYIILSDVLGYFYDIAAVFEALKAVCHPRTRLVLNFHSRLWSPAFALAHALGLKKELPRLSWVTPDDVEGLLNLRGLEVVRRYTRVLLPKRIPLLSRFCNRFLAPLWPFRHFCVSNFVVARMPVAPFHEPPVVSVICPCRNEAGNIAKIAARLPQLGAQTELIFVEGHSTDDTHAQCLKARDTHPELDIRVLKQPGKGKGDAVRTGFAAAQGAVLMILDADLTVTPEDLPRFYDALASGRVEFVNGSRLVYPMEGRAMRFLNLCANKFFGMAFTFLIEQRIKDSLCGTKVLLKSDYVKLQQGRAYFGDFDPFGDFDLLFGAAKLNLKIQDLPIRYRDRTYGETNISRFRHGWLLLRMCVYAFRRIKCP